MGQFCGLGHFSKDPIETTVAVGGKFTLNCRHEKTGDITQNPQFKLEAAYKLQIELANCVVVYLLLAHWLNFPTSPHHPEAFEFFFSSSLLHFYFSFFLTFPYIKHQHFSYYLFSSILLQQTNFFQMNFSVRSATI